MVCRYCHWRAEGDVPVLVPPHRVHLRGAVHLLGHGVCHLPRPRLPIQGASAHYQPNYSFGDPHDTQNGMRMTFPLQGYRCCATHGASGCLVLQVWDNLNALAKVTPVEGNLDGEYLTMLSKVGKHTSRPVHWWCYCTTRDSSALQCSAHAQTLSTYLL